MVRYSLSSTLFKGHIFIGYNEKKTLVFFDNKSEMTELQNVTFFIRFPFLESGLEQLMGDSQTLSIKRMVDDLSFAAIWDAYAYKVGNKARAEKLWNKLTDLEKQQVFDSLSPYAYYLMCHQNIEKLYLETYLYQRRFENDYRELNKKK